MANKILDPDIAAMRAQMAARPTIDPDIAAMRADREEQARLAKVGKLNALGQGISQGATLGFADEGSGVLAALASLGTSSKDEPYAPGFVDSYRLGRDVAREADDDAKKAHPLIHFAGELAGGVATGKALPRFAGAKLAGAPAVVNSVLPAVAQGAFQGAVSGLGGSKGGAGLSGYAKNALDTLTGGAVGGILGGAADAAGRAAAPAVQKALGSLAEGADLKRVLTARGTTGGALAKSPLLKDVEAVPGGVSGMARSMRDFGLAPKAGTVQQLQQSAQDVQAQARSVIKSVIADVDAAGGGKGVVNMDAFATRLEKEAADLADEPELFGLAKVLREKAAIYRRTFPEGATMAQAQKSVRELGKKGRWTDAATGAPMPDAQQGIIKATRALRGEMDNAAAAHLAEGAPSLSAAMADAKNLFKPGSAAPKPLDAYQTARNAFQVSKIVDKHAQEAIGRAATRNTFSLTDGVVGGLAAPLGVAAGGGAIGALAGPVAVLVRHAVTPRAAQLKAAAAEGAGALLSWLEKNPAAQKRLGSAAQALFDAARISPAALLRKHDELMSDEGDLGDAYRETVQQAARHKAQLKALETLGQRP